MPAGSEAVAGACHVGGVPEAMWGDAPPFAEVVAQVRARDLAAAPSCHTCRWRHPLTCCFAVTPASRRQSHHLCRRCERILLGAASWATDSARILQHLVYSIPGERQRAPRLRPGRVSRVRAKCLSRMMFLHMLHVAWGGARRVLHIEVLSDEHHSLTHTAASRWTL